MVSLSVEVLQRAGRFRFAALGCSMLPTLWPGDVLTIQVIPMGQLQVGDVVLFTRENRFFVHRVVRAASKTVITRGDAMPSEDGVLRDEEFLGRVVSVSRPEGDKAIPGCSAIGRFCGLILSDAHWIRSLVLRARASRLDGHASFACQVSPG
jgi:signal peptidase I